MILRQCRAAGVAMAEEDALLLEMTLMGILFTALTVSPGIGVESHVRTAVRRTLSAH
ncbi:hypothetical protein CLV63_11337 [Murinocardiopsis flavida]|uniref:TetR family transcriptional regulator n=1 Tax=Murinocardiopsis flavida TaxID=645275 RepID=A0A2P8DF85_9ACTN|nr:hypothetical protein [Murinocardiopsis flavida]PSK95874.1 hypothetical protein CLV63_11337 [Murinocardiopsis flavida]